MFANVVYVLCTLTSAMCAWLLIRGYARSGARLLFWSALCFIGFALNNILLIIDLRALPAVDLSTWRMVPSLVGVSLLLYGLVWEAK